MGRIHMFQVTGLLSVLLVRASEAAVRWLEGRQATFVLVNISRRFWAYVTPCKVVRHQHSMHMWRPCTGSCLLFHFPPITQSHIFASLSHWVLCKTHCRLPLGAPTFVIFCNTKLRVPSYNNLSSIDVKSKILHELTPVAYPVILFGGGGGVQKIRLRTEDRERGSGGSSALDRGSGGSCNLVQEISFHIVKFT